ncbi:Cysteine-rich receptor-like protein kinase 25, partial [Camellia lanceoleosa]
MSPAMVGIMLPPSGKVPTQFMPSEFAEVTFPTICVSTVSILQVRVMDTAPAICVLITNNITNNVDEFDQAMSTLVDSLIFRAAMSASTSSGSSRLKFVTGKENFTTDQDIYALMQCTPDLSSADCSNCLRGAVDIYRSICYRKIQANVLAPSCVFHYELNKFYEFTTDASPPPPPPPPIVTLAPPPSTPSINTTTKADEDASQTVDSLRFDFATIRVATNDFSNANKLGQGGFGWVYK